MAAQPGAADFCWRSRLSPGLLLPIKFIENIHRRDVDQASASAPPAAHAAQLLVGLQDILAFAQEAMPLTHRAALAEVVAARDSRKLVQLARVPDPHSLPMPGIHFGLISHVKAEAGWTDAGAGPAREAPLTQFGPERTFH